MRYTVHDYLKELVNYGGIPTPRVEVIADLKRIGLTQRQIDWYLFGLDNNKGGLSQCPPSRM